MLSSTRAVDLPRERVSSSRCLSEPRARSRSFSRSLVRCELLGRGRPSSVTRMERNSRLPGAEPELCLVECSLPCSFSRWRLWWCERLLSTAAAELELLRSLLLLPLGLLPLLLCLDERCSAGSWRVFSRLGVRMRKRSTRCLLICSSEEPPPWVIDSRELERERSRGQHSIDD